MLLEQIKNDMKLAMKNKEKEKLSTLRLLISAINNKKIELRVDELSDQQIHEVIFSEIKKLDQEIEGVRKAGRDDSSQLAQKAILQSYLPPQLTEDEIRELVKQIIESEGITSKKEKGKLMKTLTPQVKGKADMKLVAQIVDQELNQL